MHINSNFLFYSLRSKLFCFSREDNFSFYSSFRSLYPFLIRVAMRMAMREPVHFIQSWKQLLLILIFLRKLVSFLCNSIRMIGSYLFFYIKVPVYKFPQPWKTQEVSFYLKITWIHFFIQIKFLELLKFQTFDCLFSFSINFLRNFFI